MNQMNNDVHKLSKLGYILNRTRKTGHFPVDITQFDRYCQKAVLFYIDKKLKVKSFISLFSVTTK